MGVVFFRRSLYAKGGSGVRRGLRHVATDDSYHERIRMWRASRNAHLPITAILESTIRLELGRKNFPMPQLRKRWLLAEPTGTNETPTKFGDHLDVKSRNLRFETGTDEAVVLQFFQVAAKGQETVLFFRRENWFAGHLLLLTSAHRIVWITNYYKRYRELYAAIDSVCAIAVI